MASARKKGKYFYARWRTRDGRDAEKGGFLTKKDAITYGRDQESLERKHRNTKPSDLQMTLLDFVRDIWSKTLDVKRQTKADYERALNSHIIPQFGNTRLCDIKPADIEAWMVRMKNLGPNGKLGLSDRTVEKHANLLAAILRKAVANEYLDKSPFISLKRKKSKSKRKVVPYDYAMVKKIADNFGERFRILIWIGFYTGMRPSEALALTWGQLDFESGTIKIDRQLSRFTTDVFESHLKTNASNRTIGFAKELQRLIREHVTRYGLGPENLILQNRSGRVWRYEDAALMFRKAVQPLGIQKGEGLHNLRHTCVSVLIHQGANAKQIQAWVGHESILETMDIYGHLYPNSLNDLSEKLDEFANASVNMDISTGVA